MLEQRPEEYLASTGKGFVTGQAFAAAGALYHALVHAHHGSRLEDFTNGFASASFETGSQMAS
jgi:hypothetical protein